MQALILAGGKGTRLRPITLSTPKPITPIANRPFLFYQLDLLRRAGAQEIILSLSYQPEKIMQIFGDGKELGLSLSYTVEPEPLGTAGAFKYAESQINSTTIVLNGDILTDIDLTAVVARHRERGAMATIVLVPVENPSAYGLVEINTDGRVERFLEKPKPDEITCNTINAGLYVLEPAVLKYIPANENHSFEYGLFPRLLAEREPFFADVSNGYWLDIGTNARYLQANLDLLAGQLSYQPERASSEKFHSQAKIDARSLVDDRAIISAQAEILNSVIGSNCRVGAGARIENSVLLSDTRVDEQARITGAIVGRGCRIGECAIIGAGAVLGDESIITDYSQTGGVS